MADGVWHDDEVLRGVERLAGAEQLARKARADELRAGAASAVHDEDGVADASVGVALRRADGAVVQPQFRQDLARCEAEVADDVIGLGDGGLRSGQAREQQDEQESTQVPRIADRGSGTHEHGG